MNEHFKSVIVQATGASSLGEQEIVQELWSGYGHITRVFLKGGSCKSVMVKHIQLASDTNHPRGWNTDIGHQRKLTSYRVETTWYDRYSEQSLARMPHCLTIDRHEDDVFIVLEDLDEAGFPIRKHSVNWEDIVVCLNWLATFHASFLGKTPEGLWNVGTYWHLETRPQELRALNDQRLKRAAPLIDEKLSSCTYQTIVHGDAKLANFCFSPDGNVAGLDFQYVGGGCGMKDVAYFIGSCLDEDDCERLEAKILDTYFERLREEMGERNEELEREWRSMYRVAWADFHRFLKGWSPGHWKINSYSERVTEEVIQTL